MNTSTDYRNDINSLIKDIVEREKIISDYKKYGILDRDKAINKIQELRIKDKEVEKSYNCQSCNIIYTILYVIRRANCR